MLATMPYFAEIAVVVRNDHRYYKKTRIQHFVIKFENEDHFNLYENISFDFLLDDLNGILPPNWFVDDSPEVMECWEGSDSDSCDLNMVK
jgi:hypothetical protein